MEILWSSNLKAQQAISSLAKFGLARSVPRGCVRYGSRTVSSIELSIDRPSQLESESARTLFGRGTYKCPKKVKQI